MQFRQIRKILRQAVFAGVSLSLASCVFDEHHADCVEVGAQTFRLDMPADPALQLRIDSCHVDVDACEALCSMALRRAGLVGELTSCKVKLHPDAASVKVTYQIRHDGTGCAARGPLPQRLAQR